MRLCGYYAVAAALAVCHSVNPSGMEFDPRSPTSACWWADAKWEIRQYTCLLKNHIASAKAKLGAISSNAQFASIGYATHAQLPADLSKKNDWTRGANGRPNFRVFSCPLPGWAAFVIPGRFHIRGMSEFCYNINHSLTSGWHFSSYPEPLDFIIKLRDTE